MAVGVEGPRASSPGPVWLPAASAGLPSQLPGAVPPLVGVLAPGGAPKKGPPVGEGVLVAGPAAPGPSNTREMVMGSGKCREAIRKKTRPELSQRLTEGDRARETKPKRQEWALMEDRQRLSQRG